MQEQQRHVVARTFLLALLVLGAATSSAAAQAAEEPASATPLRRLRIGGISGPSRVPDPWLQHVFPHPQSIAAVDVTSDGSFVGIATLAFRHDHNFWLLGDTGQVVEKRHVQPWAPFQVTVLPGARVFGVGLAYSRFTSPNPTISFFEAGKEDETVALEDSWWEAGWLRYGSGDWRTGWPVSIVGDLLVRANRSAITVRSHNGAWHVESDGSHGRFPALDSRPLRMTVSADGTHLATGYIVPDQSQLNSQTRQWLRDPPALLVVQDLQGETPTWRVEPSTDAPPVDRPPEPADEFPEFAEQFNIQPQALVAFRAAASISLNADAGRAALTEYGGWIRVKHERGIGGWNPKYATPFCPRQRGRLRIFELGHEIASTDLPADGLFDVHLDHTGDTVWCAPLAWFARGLAGRGWLPADQSANIVFLYDVRRKVWTDVWQFPDAASDLSVHPSGDRALISCWDGVTYLVDRDGEVRQRFIVDHPARVRWSADGTTAVIGTDGGKAWSVDADGQVRWETALPAARTPPAVEPNRPVFADVPIYVVGRVGQEHAYVGDIWLVRGNDGAFIVDAAGTSAIPFTWQRMHASGSELDDVRHLLLTHTHGDHLGGAYLWRTQGLRVVAPATAALSATWLPPTWSDYGIWPPCPIDQPLPLKQIGDVTDFTLAGLPIRAVFVAGHSFDSVIYLVDFGNKRVAFTGDIGFVGQDIVRKCWGDVEKAAQVLQAIRNHVLPFHPDYVFTGHDAQKDGTAFLQELVRQTEKSLGIDGAR